MAFTALREEEKKSPRVREGKPHNKRDFLSCLGYSIADIVD